MASVLALRPLVAWPVIWYLAFVAATLLRWRMLLFLWPYPLLLCLQKLVPDSLSAFVAACVLGLGSVLAAVVAAHRLVGRGRPPLVLAVPLALIVAAIPLLVIEV